MIFVVIKKKWIYRDRPKPLFSQCLFNIENQILIDFKVIVMIICESLVMLINFIDERDLILLINVIDKFFIPNVFSILVYCSF